MLLIILLLCNRCFKFQSYSYRLPKSTSNKISTTSSCIPSREERPVSTARHTEYTTTWVLVQTKISTWYTSTAEGSVRASPWQRLWRVATKDRMATWAQLRKRHLLAVLTRRACCQQSRQKIRCFGTGLRSMLFTVMEASTRGQEVTPFPTKTRNFISGVTITWWKLSAISISSSVSTMEMR